MNTEDLFESFGALDDDLLKRSEHRGKKLNKNAYSTIGLSARRSAQMGIKMKKRRKASELLKYGSIAACLVVILGISILFIDNESPNPTPVVPEISIISDNNDDISDEETDLQVKSERYVNVSMLLASNESIETQAHKIALVEIENYSAHYYKVASVESDILQESIGHDVPGTQMWYKVSGHEDMQYLIFNDNNEYSLWKFESFQEESYPYSDVLQIIYNIHSAEDIDKVIVAPANMDNSDKGQAIQEEIGTNVVTDDKAIETIYNVLVGLICYGGNNWDMIGLEEDTPSSMQNQVRAGRFLTMATSQGMEVDTLKYTGISGMFYEYGGIAYSALTMEEKTAVEKILNIELPYETDNSVAEQNKQTESNEPEASRAAQDIPVDEETYQEAREYSAELTDLQNRISQAMMNKELPFVTSSAIYENPDRIHVTVNTTDEDLIAKLQAFDTTGKLLEIEYSEQRIWNK